MTYEARLAVCALILGVGGLLKQRSTPELITASHYLAQAGAADGARLVRPVAAKLLLTQIAVSL